MASALDNLASVYKDEARYAEAEPLYKQALAIREKALPPVTPMWRSREKIWPTWTAPRRTAPAVPKSTLLALKNWDSPDSKDILAGFTGWLIRRKAYWKRKLFKLVFPDLRCMHDVRFDHAKYCACCHRITGFVSL